MALPRDFFVRQEKVLESKQRDGKRYDKGERDMIGVSSGNAAA